MDNRRSPHNGVERVHPNNLVKGVSKGKRKQLFEMVMREMERLVGEDGKK